MAIVISEVGVTIKGNVVRKFNGTTTTLRVSAEQARELRKDLDQVLTILEPPAGATP